MFKLFAKLSIQELQEKVAKYEKDIEELLTDRDKIQEEVHKLKVEKRQIKLENKIEVEDIKHMVRVKEERLDIKYEKKVVELEKKLNAQLLVNHNDYRDKVEKLLEKGQEQLRSMYSEILQRLPDIDVAIKGKI